ncbi:MULTISPECIES: hypothetical protein [unclassified Streptomyces]|uniref:hypothetical protein n=1 Tax=unclassified Streptomyces TaxID=2593676 RepID=UPI0034250AEE
MSPALRVIVYPLVTKGGRRVRCDGEILGCVPGAQATYSSSCGGPALTRTTSSMVRF